MANLRKVCMEKVQIALVFFVPFTRIKLKIHKMVITDESVRNIVHIMVMKDTICNTSYTNNIIYKRSLGTQTRCRNTNIL